MVELVLSLAGGFLGVAALGSRRARRVFRDGTPQPIDPVIALGVARYHRKIWAAFAGIGLLAFILAASSHLDRASVAAVTFMFSAATTCVRADYMLCAIDHPDVRLTISDGFIHGSIDHTIIGWVRASPALVHKIAGRHVPTARVA
jgi:hypothetical protein